MEQLQNILAILFMALICRHTAKANPFAHDELELENKSTVQLIGIESIEELKKQDPSLQIEELTPTKNVGFESVVYMLGRRVRGDNLVGHVGKTQFWKTPQNAKILITYPAAGIGARITFVYIEVAQTTRYGKAYIIRGGLGQRFITIAVEGNQVTYMHYNANIFGIP